MQGVLFKVLDKLGCIKRENIVETYPEREISVIEFDDSNLLQAISTYYHEARRFSRTPPTTLYIGWEEFISLAGLAHAANVAAGIYELECRRDDMRVFGLKVVTIPYMKGMLIV